MKDSWKLWEFKTNPDGRQWWEFRLAKELLKADQLNRLSEDFIYDKKVNPNCSDAVYRNQLSSGNMQSGPKNVEEALEKAVSYFSQLQTEGGHWGGDYGGPMFLLPGLIIASHITETPFPAAHAEMMKRYMLNHQNEDGGWGLHIEGASTIFGTVLQYVSLRILGVEAKDKAIEKAHVWIRERGGATGIPSWGKFYLSVLGVYEWEGNNSLFPEMWLLPKRLPFHPSKYWCHSRMVYLPMAYCFGNRIIAKPSSLTGELKNELYNTPYESINWAKARNECAETDLYYKQSTLLKVMNSILNVYEKAPLKSLRKKAIDFCLTYINAEDDQNNYIDIGPVNQVINSICVFHAYGKASSQFKKHVERWNDYLWVSEDGMKMQGYNGSQFWDTAFAVQCVKGISGTESTIDKALGFIERSQVKEEVRDSNKFFRHPSVGGFPFSNAEHGWPITDCTAEGLKVLLQNRKGEPERLQQAVDLILSFQNKDGGWASYELTRGPKWLELLNPSEIFGNIMIDHSYTECSSACVQSLAEFQKHFPLYKRAEIDRALERGLEFILGQQKENGSWYGSWAVCFTYGTWFGVEALEKVQNEKYKVQIEKALENSSSFLLSKQNTDGGWGESFESCVQKKYVASAESQLVNTSWALLSLIKSEGPETKQEVKTAIEKGIAFLVSQQLTDGDFPQQNITGVFNHNCMISYTNYRNIFPIWALNSYSKMKK